MTTDASNQKPSHPFFAMVYDPATALIERTLLRPHREYLVADLEGAVLDLGAGTGAMFPYFAAVESDVTTFHAIEPDPHMRRQAEEQSRTHSLDVTIDDSPAESLPYRDDTFDVVIASMVFCTIPGVETALSEVSRVLKPGGEFRFFEHVADDGWRGRVQGVLAPLWKRLAGGCHLTRQTASRFAVDSTFDIVEVERLHLGVTPIRPFVRGLLRKRA
ncbi:methyltransferase domain-containing protein [Halorubrum sp. CBA1125]|uniref:class I SAM-dependent methyltransferase n=1 Tax=Halorubrum sp. CBA1125 TaxID=2668072 RepID=UPI0012E8CF8E|nr:class I SAM-dependent methyltransferase [Halorubrum sp. CBA1125]MUW14795.1 methyltransferase domain-containing protein [Halorubrum sp. CBA1125]